VWTTGGCSSWYLDAHGRNTTLWPRTTFTLRRLLSRFDSEHYVTTARCDLPSATDRKVDA
jgi:cyclohexanone monooxygenase